MSELNPTPTAAPVLQPPLGISHLMLWIFGAAVVLGVYRWFWGVADAAPIMHLVLVANQLTFSLLAGINIAVVIVFARRLVLRDAPLMVQPGHWLLATVGVTNLGMWLMYGAALGLSKLWGIVDAWETIPFRCFPQAAAYSLAMALNVLVAVWIREPTRWRVLFLVSALFSGLLALAFWMMFASTANGLRSGDDFWRYNMAAGWYPVLYSADQIIGILVLGFNAVADGADARQRDWVHRLGVAATILQSIACLVFLWLMDWAAQAGI
jgi:hypothetical protein